MTTPRCTDADLELYHDRAMAPARAADLSQALRDDPTLRARLHHIAHADRVAAHVLTAPPAHPRRAIAARAGSRFLRPALAVAAGLALVATLALIVPRPVARPVTTSTSAATGPATLHTTTPHTTSPHTTSPHPITPALAEIPPVLEVPSGLPTDRSSAAPVLASVTLATDTDPAPTPASPAAPGITPHTSASLAANLAAILRRGDVAAATNLTRDLDEHQRRAAYAEIALTLRSALTAQAVLDALPPAEQIELCAAWADEPHLRPVAFQRLAQLEQHQDLRPRVGLVAQRLAKNATLQPWVRSFLN